MLVRTPVRLLLGEAAQGVEPPAAEVLDGFGVGDLATDLGIRRHDVVHPRIGPGVDGGEPGPEVVESEVAAQDGALGRRAGVEVVHHVEPPGGAPEVHAEPLVLIVERMGGLQEGLVNAVAFGSCVRQEGVEGFLDNLTDLRTIGSIQFRQQPCLKSSRQKENREETDIHRKSLDLEFYNVWFQKIRKLLERAFIVLICI